MTTADRRQHQRFPAGTRVQLEHCDSRREFPGRCVDISDGGLCLYVPVNTPVQVGQPIRLNMGGIPRPEFAALAEKAIDATIVRVDRGKLLRMGHVTIGVKFQPRQ